MAGGFLSWELQKATFDAVAADATVITFVGTRVYDRVPDANPRFPYITVGDSSSEQDRTKDTEAQIHSIAFEVWSNEGGREEVKKIQAAIYDVLENTNLTLDAGTVILTLYTSSSDSKTDSFDYFGEIRFDAVTQK